MQHIGLKYKKWLFWISKAYKAINKKITDFYHIQNLPFNAFVHYHVKYIRDPFFSETSSVSMQECEHSCGFVLIESSTEGGQ